MKEAWQQIPQAAGIEPFVAGCDGLQGPPSRFETVVLFEGVAVGCVDGSEAGVRGVAGVEKEHVAGCIEGDNSYDGTLKLGKVVG